MTTIAALTLSILVAPQVQLVAETTKPSYAHGEEVVIAIKIKNVGKTPAFVARAFSPIYPDASLLTSLYDAKGSALLADSNRHRGQWGGGSRVSLRSFLRIEPGVSVTVAQEKFTHIWTNERPTYKSEVESTLRDTLLPGTYRLDYAYSFDRTLVLHKGKWRQKRQLEPNYNGGYIAPYTFDAGARALYDAAFVGTLKAKVTFKVS